MVTWVVAVEERPALSVTVSVYVCTPMVTVNDTTAELPTTVLPSVQTKVSASPSGSLDSEPSSVTEVPPGPVAGRVWSGPASATGGVVSAQPRLRLPAESTVSHGLVEPPGLAERFNGGLVNVAPPSAERAKNMSLLNT